MAALQQLLMGLGGSKSLIVSVQQIQITISAAGTSNTATIAAVNTANAVVLYNGHTTAHTSSTGETAFFPALVLTNSTTVTATVNTALPNNIVVNATVVEFAAFAVKSNQSGIITTTAATSSTATIAAVTTANSVVIFQGQNVNNSAGSLQTMSDLTLTNSTTVTASNQVGSVTYKTNYTVLEFNSGILNSAVQQGQCLNGNGSATISSVSTANTMLFWQGMTYSTTWNSYNLHMYISLTNSTTVQANNFTPSSTANVRFAVVEFNPAYIKSVNRSVLTSAASAATVTLTIAAVNTAKAFVNWLGFTINAAAFTNTAQAISASSLTNSTTATATRNTAAATTFTNSLEVIEFN